MLRGAHSVRIYCASEFDFYRFITAVNHLAQSQLGWRALLVYTHYWCVLSVKGPVIWWCVFYSSDAVHSSSVLLCVLYCVFVCRSIDIIEEAMAVFATTT